MENSTACRMVYIFVCVMSLNACTTLNLPQATPEKTAQLVEDNSDSEQLWWRASVEILWNEDQEVAWHMDALLAHVIFSPIISQYSQRIEFWRFHRRAARDSAGHRFTFHFYSSASTASLIYGELNENSWISELIAEDYVKKIHTDDINENRNTNIEDNTDKKWSTAIQKSWPYFSMGVSQTWLQLIREHVGQLSIQSDVYSLVDAVEFYREVNQVVSSDWTVQGGHAFLHHLNALFGYEDIYVYERRLIRF